VVGLLVGSFLNVVIYRVPVMLNRDWREQCAELAAEDSRGPAATAAVTAAAEAKPAERFNLIVPRSACPKCKRQIRAVENIPVVSWLFLRGKCAGCGTAISSRYPIVELLTGLMSAAVAWKLGFGWPVLGGLVFTWFLIALTFIDVDTQLLPDNMTLPLLWLGIFVSLSLGGAAPTEIAAGQPPIPVDLRSSIIGAIAGYMSLWGVFHLFKLLTGKEGMGYGDFKLFAALGAWLGWKMLLPTILIAAAVGAVSGIVILSVRKQERSTPIAFGPFLAAAGWLMLMFGNELVSRYLGLFPPVH
jgi:leader peptidase (prepilin peptidase)/N-methyltransferase